MTGESFEESRAMMVEQQLVARGVRDRRVLDAMREIVREDFVPAEYVDRAYDDGPVVIGCRQTISQPYMVALMTEALAPDPDDHVLEIGTGSGYQAAVLARLVKDVTTVERHHELAVSARSRLARLGCENVVVVEGDGSGGWPDAAPYDGMLVTAAAPEVPAVMVEQLAMGGRLVIPVGSRRRQVCLVVTRTPGGILTRELTECVFVPLRGAYGWQE